MGIEPILSKSLGHSERRGTCIPGVVVPHVGGLLRWLERLLYTQKVVVSVKQSAQVAVDEDLNYIGFGASLAMGLGQGEFTPQSTDRHEQPFLNYIYHQD